MSAKDVILEMLRRHGVDGGFGRIIEYHGPGLEQLSAMDRHVIANMGAELGATTTVFPSDDEVRRFLASEGREHDWQELRADPGATYEHEDEIDFSTLEPLIACPSSPGNVVPVREVAGRDVYQVVIGSSANPGLRDFAVPAMMVKGRQTHERVSFDVNPTSRQTLEALAGEGWLLDLIAGGARLHQAGCNGCIGMGQAPATGRASLRTFPRNFPGRSGTKEDPVYLCSPEAATAAALTGVMTDPRDGPVLLKLGDDISTDEIMPAGARVLPYRSNIPAMADYAFDVVDETYPERARETEHHFIVGGDNYGQGSSREHAAIVPRYLGLRAVLAKTFARIHYQNLVNFAVLPLTFTEPRNYDRIEHGDLLSITEPAEQLRRGDRVEVVNESRGETYPMQHRLSPRQVEIVARGSLISVIRDRQQI